MAVSDVQTEWDKKSVCIIARKRLTHNTRVVRQAKILDEKGYHVTVVAIELPSQELMDMVPRVRFIQIDLNPWPARFIRLISRLSVYPGKTASRMKRLYNHNYRFLLRFLKRANRLLKHFVMRIGSSLINFFMRAGLLLKHLLIRVGLLLKRLFMLTGSLTKRSITQFMHLLYMILKFPLVLLLRLQGGQKATTDDNNGGGLGFVGLVRRLLIPYMNYAKTTDFAAQAGSLLQAERFDFCQAHDTHALPAAQRLAKKSGARLVYDALEAPEERSGIAQIGTPSWLQNLEHKRDLAIIKKANVVFSVGPALAEWTQEKYGLDSSPYIVRNCSLYREDLKNTQIRADLNLKMEERLGLVVGSIYRDQGLEELIEALCYLPDKIHIAALGPIAQPGFDKYLNEMAEARGVVGRFHILPSQPQHLVLEYASGADLGIIARQATTLNNRLSLPNKIFELIMARLPIVASRLPNIEVLVRDYGIGEVFDETDPENMASVINGVLEVGVFDGYRQAVKEAAKACCWEKESIKYVKVFEESLES